MKKMKLWLGALLVCLMLAAAFAVPLDAEAATRASGSCGDRLNWTLDDSGVLTISGFGAMWEWTYDVPAPWNAYAGSITHVVIENGVTSVGQFAFSRCINLQKLTVMSNVDTVGFPAFSHCKELTELVVGNGVTRLHPTFYSIESLKQINVEQNNRYYISEEGVLYMQQDRGIVLLRCPNSFKGQFTIPVYVSVIDDYALTGCKDLEKIDVARYHEFFSSDNGVLYDINKAVLIRYPAGQYQTSYEIPEGVYEIKRWAFTGCKRLESVKIPDSMRFVGDFAFYSCSNLRDIEIVGDLYLVGACAFEGCAGVPVFVPAG